MTGKQNERMKEQPPRPQNTNVEKTTTKNKPRQRSTQNNAQQHGRKRTGKNRRQRKTQDQHEEGGEKGQTIVRATHPPTEAKEKRNQRSRTQERTRKESTWRTTHSETRGKE